MRALALAAAAAATVCLIGFTTVPRTARLQPVDAIIGQGKFNAVFPVHLAGRADMQRQITERLVRLEPLLRSRDVSDWPADLQAERARNLDRLHDYRMRGAYTTNYDHPDRPLPCFMDRDGNFCAVAWLIAQSGELPLAEQLNRNYQYATIAEMKSPELDRWIAQSGLTRAEVTTIQVVEVVMVGEDMNQNRNRRGFQVRGIGADSLNTPRAFDTVTTSPTVPANGTLPGLSMSRKSIDLEESVGRQTLTGHVAQ